jgi:hypothetical protein
MASLDPSRRRCRQGTCPRFRGGTVTSPAPGAASAADLPDYAPVPPAAIGPALNDQEYYVGRVERNLYRFADGTNQSEFPDRIGRRRAVRRTHKHRPQPTAGRGRDRRGQRREQWGDTFGLSHHFADHAGASRGCNQSVSTSGQPTAPPRNHNAPAPVSAGPSAGPARRRHR